jgi:hypothetical protein
MAFFYYLIGFSWRRLLGLLWFQAHPHRFVIQIDRQTPANRRTAIFCRNLADELKAPRVRGLIVTMLHHHLNEPCALAVPEGSCVEAEARIGPLENPLHCTS